MRLIFDRVINCCWFCFKWGLVLGVIGAVVAVACLYNRLDEEIRCRVVERFAKHYVGLKVTVRSTELVEGEGIEVRGLSIVEPGAEGPHAELVHVDELFLCCSTDWQELIGGELQVTRITIRRPTLRATRRPDGTWSAAKLLPLPKLSSHPPEVRIENGTIEVFDPLKNPSSTLVLRDLNLTLAPPEASNQPGETTHTRKLQGTLNADHLRQVEVEGWIDPDRLAWTIGGTVEGLDISPELRDGLPGPLAAKLAVLGELRGQGTLGFQIGYDPSAESPYRFDLSGRLVRGRIDDPRLPHPLTDMRATVRLDNAGVAIDELVAHSGQATLRTSGRQEGFEWGRSPLVLQAEIRQLELDHHLLDALPEPLQEKLRQQWQKYSPAGKVHADVQLSFDGQTWDPELSVQCLDVSFSHHKFPYRLEHGKGTLELKDDVLRVMNMTAYSGSRPVQVDAVVYHPTSGPSGWFEATGEHLQLDEKLLAALPSASREVVRSLDPRGTVNFRVRMWRDEPNGPLRKDLVIDLNRCSIRYDRFPYPLGNIRGALVMRDDHWTFRDLEGTNDTGRVTCEGYMTTPQQGRELFLRLAGIDVPLEEELRDALRPNIQLVWNELRPRGTADLLAEIRYLPETKKLDVSVRAEPQGESTSIEPVHFPYRMEKLRGVLVYQDGRVTVQRFKAEHGPVSMAASGQCDFLPDGRWNLRLEGLSVDRLRADRELIQALPVSLKKAIAELKPSGQIDLRGTFGLEAAGSGGGPVRSRWNLALGFNQGSIDCGVKLENLHGSMTLAGEFDGQHFHSRGELAIDSLTYKDYQFTQVMGPVWIDDRQVLLGSWVDRRVNEGSALNASHSRQQPRSLSAKLFGGNVYGDAWVSLGPQPRYGLRATLAQGDLRRFAQEVMAGRQNFQGKIMATIDLGGAGRSRNAMAGRGTIRLREADVWELPLMVALLKILSIRPPDQTAFSKSDIDFRIEGEHIYFDRVNFNGDAISLLGQGWMDFDSKIGLTFYSIVGRDDFQVPVLRELVGGASQQIMQIRVGGTLQNPETRKEAFPGVNQALQQLQDDLEKGTGSQGLFPEARNRMPDVGRKGGGKR